MKTFIWSVLIVVLLSVLLLTLEFPSMGKSAFRWNFSRFGKKVLVVSGCETAAEQLAKAFRGNRPEAWFDDIRAFQREMQKRLLEARPKTPERPNSGIPSIAYYDKFIMHAGTKNNIDPALIKALIWRESRFNHIALGEKGEVGLMQIMPGERAAAADWAIAHCRLIPSEEELFNPELNIEVGAWYLARALNRYRGYRDAIALALCEYNAGPSRAEEWVPDPDTPDESVFELISISSTKKYVRDILNKYEDYKKELNPGRNQ